MPLDDQIILITGGTGSFGRKFVDVALRDYNPRKIIIFSRDEWKQHDMRMNGYNDSRLRYFIGDVRDEKRLYRALGEVDIIVHAAALKQVPACEYNPIEAVATNINGARHVIDTAIDRKVKNVIALSTDKATAPINLYGATKLVAEKLFVQANAYSGFEGTHFSCVRYGNVIGSRGSVIPLFKQQRNTGKLTITDERMTRFWITLEQSARFVISCLDMMRGGEVFIPKLPSMRMVDLARAICADCELEFIGIRPGEKIHEALISKHEARQAIELEDRYALLPAQLEWARDAWAHAKRLPDGFAYTSDTNKCWLTPENMLQMIDDF